MQQDTAHNNNKAKTILFYLFLVFLVVAIPWFFLELMLIIFYPQQESQRWFVSSKSYAFENKKNYAQDYKFLSGDFIMHVKTNSWGHRAKEYSKTKFSDRNIRKIFLLGDSFTFGYGLNVGDTFPFMLYKKLKTIKNQEYQIINSGVGGWGTLQETKYGAEHLREFNPDIIILTFCQNDPSDDYMFSHNKADNLQGFPGKIFLRDYSHLARFIRYILVPSVKHNLNQVIVKKADTKSQDPQTNKAISETEWIKTQRYIKEFHKKFMEYNPSGRLLVQATKPWDEDIRKHLAILDNGINLRYVDLYEKTKKLTEAQRQLKYDWHWTILVHQIATNELYKNIMFFTSRR